MALNGDKTTTGATCVATIETVTCFNKKALRVGDPTTQCPKCGQAGVVISGQQGFLNHGKHIQLAGNYAFVGQSEVFSLESILENVDPLAELTSKEDEMIADAANKATAIIFFI
ncbi:PAAR domain-containing protein [Providencia rettgeri]